MPEICFYEPWTYQLALPEKFEKILEETKVYYYCREEDKFIMLQGRLKMLVTTIRMDEEN